MKVENGKVILDSKNDYEFVGLIVRLAKIDHGEAKIEIRDSKPFRIIETKEAFLLKKD